MKVAIVWKKGLSIIPGRHRYMGGERSVRTKKETMESEFCPPQINSVKVRVIHNQVTPPKGWEKEIIALIPTDCNWG